MNLSVKPVFSFNLNHKTTPGIVTIGKYDGTHACLTAATSADKIIIHCPHRRSGISNSRVTWSEVHHDIASLTLSQPVTAIKAGKLIPDDDREILVIGSPTHVLAYHVDNNTDVFYKEMSEGARVLTIGYFSNFTDLLVLIGGNGCIRGFNYQGNEIFWVVTGGNVISLTLMDINNDGKNELIVGSDDASIKIFKGEQVLFDFSESGAVQNLIQLGTNQLAYTVNNGTVGVYEEGVRLWRIKSKNRATSISSYDLLGMGTPQLITGWENGKIDMRDSLSGDVLFKLHLSQTITGIYKADYRGIGKNDLICCGLDGEVRGYTTSRVNLAPVTVMEQEQIRDLLSAKQALTMELQHYESNAKFNRDMYKDDDKRLVGLPEGVGIIPANTRLQIGISTNIENTSNPHIEISVSTNNSTIIRAVLIFAEGLFSGETLIAHPNSRGSSRIVVPLKAPKDFGYDIHIKAFVGYHESQQFHVFELTRQLPKFSMYALPQTISGSPKNVSFMTNLAKNCKNESSFVSFKIIERMQRICMWINQNFLLPADIEPSSSETSELKLLLTCLRNSEDLILNFEADGEIKIFVNDLEVAGNLIQSLTEFLNVDHLMTTAFFPKVFEELKELFRKLDGLQDAFKNLNSDVSQKVNTVKNLIIRAEDARTYDEDEMMKHYNELMGVNDDLISNYTIRLRNFNEMQKTLKMINEILQRASKLRVGKHATSMMKFYKDAVKNNNVNAIIKIIETGSD